MTTTLRRALLHVSLLCGVLALPAPAASEPAATPYRPTVSNPAALPVPGYVELEFGALRIKGGEARRRTSATVLAKYAFSENFGLLIGGEPRVHQANHNGDFLHGAGDTSMTLKFRHELDDDSALGLETGVKAATAKTGIGSGKTDYLLNIIYSRQMGDYALDLNLGYPRFGVTEPSEGRHGLVWAAAFGGPVAGKWGAAVELSGTARQGERHSPQFLTALTYNISRQTVLDGGVAFGLSSAAPNLTMFVGLTLLFN